MTLKTQYQALVAKSKLPPPQQERLQKPATHKIGEPEVTEFQGRAWKWCNKCFGGSWNHTHITEEHVAGKGKQNHHHPPPSDNNNNNNNTQANVATLPSPSSPTTDTSATPPQPQANVTPTTSFSLDFV